jgi:Protein of unknown function (DUF3300)
MTKVVLAIAVALVLNGVGTPAPDGRAAVETSPATADELDRLLAPVALYPDQLLAQMLLCAGNPSKVAAFNEWLASHESVTGTALQDAARASGFEPSFVALALFPEVVQTMAGQLDWTTKLGEAFAADRSAVFASIQRLRAKARDAGTLKTTPQQEVETRTTSSGQQVIVIEPANPQVVYVPQYDSQVVYTQPATSSTVVIQKEDDDDAEAAVAGLIGFTAGVAIGAAMDNNYYYGPYGWHGGAYMYNDAWDDWYDDREDAREDWYENREDVREDYQDRREDLADERGERAGTQQEQRTERQQNRQNNPEAQAQREQRRTEAQTTRAEASSTGAATYESRGKGQAGERASGERSGTRSDAFSGYSSGRSERAASSRGQSSRGSARGGGRRR